MYVNEAGQIVVCGVARVYLVPMVWQQYGGCGCSFGCARLLETKLATLGATDFIRGVACECPSTTNTKRQRYNAFYATSHVQITRCIIDHDHARPIN
jgi:hypothetical protein